MRRRDGVSDMRDVEAWTTPEEAFEAMNEMVREMQELVWKHEALGVEYSDGLMKIRDAGWVEQWNAYLMGEDAEDGLE